ncbi:uracil-DNA glycosylase family protein [Burkholderiaceae bacterium UC74_6]
MSWDDRQKAMLEAMGLKVWGRPAMAEPEPESEPEPEPELVAAPAAQVSPAPAPAPSRAPVQAPPPAAIPIINEAERSARAQAIAEMDWNQLRDSVAGCRACGLCEGRKNTVFGVGNENAEWMIIGEAPGEQEDLRGEPFVGEAGKLLDNMLRAIGLTRAEEAPERQVFIANTLKCRPPRNRNPEPAELVQCEPYLQRQIALVQPKMILAMGRFAVQFLLRSSEAIGRLRGRVHEVNGIPVIVTYHPAYLLRNLPDKALAWDDLCLAVEQYESARTKD